MWVAAYGDLMNRPVTFAMVCSYAGIALIFILPRYAGQQWDWRDYTALTAFILLLGWLFSSRGSAGLVSADSHEDARNSLAFRLGKSLNRVRSRFRR